MADLAPPNLGALSQATIDFAADLALVFDVSGNGTGKIPVGELLYNHQRWVGLTDGATISPDAAFSHNIRFQVTLAGNRTLNAPTNAVDGGVATFRFKQDGTGSRTLTLAAGFVVPADITFALSTGANLSDYMTAVYHATEGKWVILALTKGAAL